MPNYKVMRSQIEKAEAELKKAIEALHPMEEATQLEFYVLGYVRAAQTVLKEAREAIEKTRAIEAKVEEQDTGL